MKKIILIRNIFIAFMFITIFSISSIYASSISVSQGSVSMNIGATTTITVTGSDAIGQFSISSSNAGVAKVSTGSIWVDGSESFVITAVSAGSASITVSPTNVANSLGEENISVASKTISVKVNAPTTTTPTTNTTTTTTKPTANLKRLVPSVEGLTPTFNPNTTKYTLIVPSSLNTLDISATVETVGSKYWVSGNENLKMGDNTVNITVTATNGTKKVYTIIVTKAADAAKANAKLSNLVIDGYTLNPTFSSENYEYDLGEIEASIKTLNILAYPESEKAKVDIIGNDELKDGENSIKVRVTAEDGSTTKEYTIKLNKKTDESGLTTGDTDTQNLLKADEDRGNIFTRNWVVLLTATIGIVEAIIILVLYEKLRRCKKENNPDLNPDTDPDPDKDKLKKDDSDNGKKDVSRRRSSKVFLEEKDKLKEDVKEKIEALEEKGEEVESTIENENNETEVDNESVDKEVLFRDQNGEKENLSDDASIIKQYLKDINID